MKLATILVILLLCGMGSSAQTAINSRLRRFLKGPILATTISFVVGWAMLLSVALFVEHDLTLPSGTAETLPLWAWLGGPVGVYCIATNILIFPKLGSLRVTITMTIGQILVGMMIDQFGWLGTTPTPLSFGRIAGAAAVLAGLFIYVSGRTERAEGTTPPGPIWYLLGLSVGAGFAVQAAMNGLLSRTIDSSVEAALISFSTALAVLLAIVLAVKSERCLVKTTFSCGAPAWAYSGGLLGAVYVTVIAWLMPILGVGASSVASIFGMLMMSLLIDRFGLIGAEKTKIGKAQYIGLAVIAVGVVLVNLG